MSASRSEPSGRLEENRPSSQFVGQYLRQFLGPAVIVAACIVAYLPGLNGPFLFDDFPNIVDPINAWLRGDIEWLQIVLGNRSGALGRPIAMLSFVANAGSNAPLVAFPFKLTNLFVHLACGAILFAVTIRLLARDRSLSHHRYAFALLATGLWLLHPIQVSTVLYTVQRMAQLSALFTLAGLLAFVHGRACIEEGRHRAGLGFLFLLLPGCALLATLSKENGVLLPLLCGVIELAYFQPVLASKRPTSVRAFFALSLWLPGTLAVAAVMVEPQRWLGGYAGRRFTLIERLLSEARVLFDYMGALLLPQGPQLGIYTDDFVVSKSILEPVTTLIAVVGLSLLILATWYSRRAAPTIFAGLGLFFAGHALESSILPLELYFEHRNYLPSAGFILATVAACHWALNNLLLMTDNPARMRFWLNAGGLTLLLTFAAATWARAGIWSSLPLLVEQGVRHHPHSLRANWDQARLLMEQGRINEARLALHRMSQLDNPTAVHVAAIQRVFLQCAVERRTTEPMINQIRQMAGAKLELSELLMFENLARHIQLNECEGLDRTLLADVIAQIVEAAPQPESLTQLWRNRFFAAKLYASSGNLVAAERQLTISWATKHADPAVGVFLAEVQIALGDIEQARRTMLTVRPRIPTWDQQGQAKLAELNIALRRVPKSTQ